MLQHQTFKRIADIGLVRRRLGAVHGPVTHDNDPGRLGTVHTGEIIGEPLILLVVLLGLPAAVNGAEGSAVGDVRLVLRRVRLIAGEVAHKRPLGTIWVVGLAVDGDEVGQAVVERVPKIADAARLCTGHAEAVLIGSVVSLGGRAAVVSQGALGSGRICLVLVEIGGQFVVGPVKLAARSLMVTRQDHVWNFGGQVVGPLLPQVPVGLVEDTHVTTLRSSLIGDLARWQRNQILGGNRVSAGKLGRSAIVAHRPVILARQDTRRVIIGVRDVATVPSECNSVGTGRGLEELLVGSTGVGITHVIQHSDGEGFRVTGRTARGEAQDIRSSCAIGRYNLVVVGRVCLQASDLHIMEELTALCDYDLRARGRTIIAKTMLRIK